LKVALEDKPPIPFAVPPGIKLIRVNSHTGMRAGPGDPKVILEAFKPGTAPPDNYSVIGADSANGTPIPPGPPPDAGNVVRTGTGGLY
jgi:penicillin-binding protein 1A